MLFSNLAAAWLLLCAVSVALSLMNAESALREELLPLRLRVGVTASELLDLALVVAATGGLLASLRLIPSRLGGVVIGMVALVPVTLYAASWLAFSSAGRFLDWAGFAFAATNPVLFLEHVAHLEPYFLAIAPVSLIAGVGVLTVLLPSVISRLAVAGQRSIVAVAALSLLCCTALTTFTPNEQFPANAVVIDPDAGFTYTHRELYERCRDERSGPVTHAWSDVRARWVDDTPVLLTDETIELSRRPIISFDEYRSKVDKDSLRRLNVIVIVIESLRPDQLVAQGGIREVMPSIDAVARSGIVFSDAYTQSSHSSYADLCPLSAHYPLRSPGVHIYPRNPSYPRVLIYDVLKSLGWHTAIVSSQNESWGGMINYLDTGSVDHLFHAETFDGPTYVPRNDWGFEKFVNRSKRSGKIDDRYTVDEAIRWIGGLEDEAPFFMYLNLQNSHLPYETPADFPRRFGPSTIPFQIRFSGYPKDQIQTVKNVYADSLAYIDHHLARLLSFLDDTDRRERTVLVVTSDTGQAFYEHGFVAHGSRMFNEVMRVPLIFSVPDAGGFVDDKPAQHIDVPPTLLGFLGLPPHPAFQGKDLSDSSGDWRWRSRYLVAQTPLAHEYAIVRNDFKLLYDAARDSTLLFNLRDDPGERTNLAATYASVAQELRLRLDTWRRAQMDYYRSVATHSRTYPPVLEE